MTRTMACLIALGWLSFQITLAVLPNSDDRPGLVASLSSWQDLLVMLTFDTSLLGLIATVTLAVMGVIATLADTFSLGNWTSLQEKYLFAPSAILCIIAGSLIALGVNAFLDQLAV